MVLTETTIEIGTATRMGPDRSANQDAFLAAPAATASQGLGLLFAVADGMGGHPGGAVASRLACNALSAYYGGAPKAAPGPAELLRRLADLIYRIDRQLRRQGRANPELAEMGTTLSCLLVAAGRTIIAHVGDSRIYRLRRGRLSCLTTDHTFVAEMIAEGELTRQAAQNHPLRHVLTQALGGSEPLEAVHMRTDRLQAGDQFLLCTDGLHTVLDEDRIAAVLQGTTSAAEAAAALVSEALSSGARDDLTALVLRTAGRSPGGRGSIGKNG